MSDPQGHFSYVKPISNTSEIIAKTSGVATEFGGYGMPPPTSNTDLWPFDLETGMRVASKVENLPSKFGHDRPLRFRIIRNVRDWRAERQTDGQMDGQKQRLLPPSLRSGA